MVDQPIKSIIGPSHVLRWQDQVSNGIVASQFNVDMFHGRGGYPIWSLWLLQRAIETAGKSHHIVVMVGDFRFGNRICLNPDQQATLPLFNDNFQAIDLQAITIEHDAYMLERCLNALREWHLQFGNRARYIFWCQLGREVQDRLAGRHIGASGYRHPTFNYHEIVAQLPMLDIVDLSPLLRMPMHEVSRLFIDTSCHPSRIGYDMLEAMLSQSLDVSTAYNLAVGKTEAKLLQWARQISKRMRSTVVLTGRSVWLDTLVRYLGARGALSLAESGLILAPLDRAPGQTNLADICNQRELSSCAAVIVSAGGADISHWLADTSGIPVEVWRQIPVIDWEMSAYPVIEARKEIPRFQHLNTDIAVHPNRISHTLTPAMLELGPQAIPTWLGLEYLLDCIASERVPSQMLAPSEAASSTKDYHIEEDVLLTKKGIAYLIGKDYFLLKYAKGELSPSQKSLENFNRNLASRISLATHLAISYAHVIFPEKQSVLKTDFPAKSLRRLGTQYLQQLDPALKPYVLYPAEILSRKSPNVFYPADTHMTDQGTLVIMQLLLAQLGIDASSVIDRVANRILKLRTWVGDLGNRFSPKLYQNAKLLDPDWPVIELSSPGGFTDGLIDIVLSPDAPTNQTLLIFDDSCFRTMLRHLSAVFKRIICLRTPFLHGEMVELLQPDIVLTGNVERHLAHVKAETEAKAFFLYPHLQRASEQSKNSKFIATWNALISPKAERSKLYLDSLGVGYINNTQHISAPSTMTKDVSIGVDSNLKVLIATHHLYRWGGSELVAIELFESFRHLGHEVVIYCPCADAEFVKAALGNTVQVFTEPDELDLRTYDLVYCQHQTISRVISAQKGNFPFEGNIPIFIYNHLSPFEQFEFPGPFIEAVFADIILCNSNETKRRISQFGTEFQQAILFPNPAPEEFEHSKETLTSDAPIRLLSVSNHLPKELSEAFEILSQQGIHVTRIGHPNEQSRVSPDDIKKHQAVITIGKTVQYALRARRPVYCYDYFGGPGWLTIQNRESAADKNFSGRSHPRKLQAEEIAKEIIDGFLDAYNDAQSISESFLESYRLENVMKGLIHQALQLRSKNARWAKTLTKTKDELRRNWAHEAEIYHLLDRNFLSGNPFAEKIIRSAGEFRKMRTP